MRLKYQATICCEQEANGHGCTEVGEYEVVADGKWELFREMARGYFQRLGWVCDRTGPGPKNLCPMHAKRA